MEIDIGDLRSEKRTNQALKILVSYPHPSGNGEFASHAGTTHDISVSGLKLVARQSMPIYAEVPVEIAIEQQELPFKFNGEIRWCLEVDPSPMYYIGIRLNQVLNGDDQKWVAFVQSIEGSAGGKD